MKTSKRGKAITNIALVTIMVASVMVAMIGSAGAATSADGRYNEIAIQTEAQTVLIGQDLRFVGYWGDAPVISRLVSGDIENTYKATESGGTYYIYNVNWPTSGAFYVNYVKTGTTVTFDAQLSVEDPKMPLKLKVKDKEVSSIARTTILSIDVGGINLDDKDIVSLVIIGPSGQITEKNNQKFKDITVSTLKDMNEDRGNPIDTTGWDVGHYTFQVKTVPEKACNLEDQSVKKELNMMKGTVQIKADTTEVPELTVVQLAVTGAAGHHITVAPVPVSKNAYFPAGLDDNPRAADTLWFNDVIDDDGTRTYAVEFNDTGTYTIRVTDNNEVDSYDTVDIIVTAKDVMFDMPGTVLIGDRFHIKGTTNTGTTVDVFVNDVLYVPLNNLVIDENGEFDTEVIANSGVGMGTSGTVKLKAWIECSKSPGDAPPVEPAHGEMVFELVEKTVHILNYTDYGIDTDGDGKYDYLAVDVRVNVKTTGIYRIDGNLKDHTTGDNIVGASTDRILDVGVQDVTLKFNGYPIYRHGASVKFDLKDLNVYDKDWNRLDYRSFAYTTSYYSYTYFDVPPADIAGSYSNYGIDTDGDGKYNYLAIDVWVNVKEAGYYSLGGWLDEDGNKHITYASTDLHLNKGLQKVTLKFNGYEVYRCGVNAQFVLGYLGLTVRSGEDWNIVDQKWDAHTTSFYYYTDFDKPPADLTGSYSNYGIDTDGDGKYDYLAIDAWVNVKEGGYYNLQGWLDDCYGHDVTSGGNYSYLEEGLQKLTLEFNGYEIYRHGVSGSFDLGHVKLLDSGWNVIEEKWDVYSTANYAYTNFDKPPIDLTGAYADYGVDTDGNGKSDYLAIDIGVNVKEAGTYSVSGNVYDNENDYITSGWAEVELSTGLQKLTLKFEGYTIYRNGVEGPFNLGYVALSDEWNRADYKYDAYVTSYYNYTEFDRKFTGEFNDYGLDTDEDGLYNYLVVVAEVNITKVGEYQLGGYLQYYDEEKGYWVNIEYNPNITYLETGIQSITLQFDGIEIYNSKYSGSFKVLLRMYEPEEGDRVDEMEYFTNDYDYTDFQKPPVEFAQGFNDYGLDTNGNSLYDYLVIEKEIIVKKAGNYRLSGSLKSPSGETIDSDSNYTYLNAGLQSVKLQFYGPSIYNAGESGNFDVNMDLYMLDSTTNTTTYYSYTDFERPPAVFTGNFTDYGLDTDSDGLYNYLEVEAEVNVKKAGEYELRGYLYPYQEEGGEVEAEEIVEEIEEAIEEAIAVDYDSNRTYLEIGIHNIMLQFDGIEIYTTEHNGSFSTRLNLYEPEEGERIEGEKYFTNSYNYTEFQRPPAEFTAGFNDYGLDTNGNSLYDYLVIEKELVVREAGNYQLSGSLKSPSGESIGSDSNSTYLNAGLQSIKLQFYGPSIYSAGESGNFDVNMNLYMTDDWRMLGSTTNTTSYYSYTDFERPPAEFASGFNDYCVDTDEDGIYNYLVVEAEVNVTKAGEYKLGGSLKYPALGEGYPWAEIDSDWNRTHLEVGIHKITLQFDGIEIYNTKYSGSFSVWLSLYEAEEGNSIDEEEYFTNSYNYTEFQRPPAEFASGFNDYGLDTNGNALYDYLVIEKEILVREAGNYRLQGWLKSISGETIEYDYNNTYLDVGLQSVKLQFYGPSIYNAGESGNFNVYIDLYKTDDWSRLDSTTNTTSYYGYSDFERPPAEFTAGFNDYGLDTNSNSLYDYLVIEKEILVREAGNYQLYGSLKLPSGETIDSDSNYTYLDVGLHSLKLQFYGPSIYNKEESGNFDVILNLYDRDNGEGLGTTTNTTSYYSYTDFEVPSAEFTGNFNDYGVDTDNDALYNYIVIESEITVKKAGEYNLYCTLRAPSGSWIGSASNRTYLDVGIHNVTSMFSGYRLQGYNGSFKAELTLRVVEEWAKIDEAEYVTSEYHYTDFDPVLPPAIVSLTANPNTNISKDNPAVISTTVTGDYFREIILFAGEKVESNETTNTYELRSYEQVPSDEWVFVGSNTYDLTAEWNATAIGSYGEEGYYRGCYYATDGINETYPLIWEFPAERKDNEFNRTIYLITYGSFLHNGTWYDAAIRYFPDTEKVECVYVSSDMVFLNTTDPKLIEDYPNAKPIDPNSKCKFNNLLIKTASNGTIIGFPFGYGGEETRESNELRIGDLKIKKNVQLPAGDYLIGMNVQDEAGNSDIKGTTVFTSGISQVFDTGSGTYPSISGTHNGTIKPFYNINVSKMYTYPCAGTGGHSESVRIWGDSVDVNGTWDGYTSDWHNITLPEQVTLLAGHTYNYTLRTGSYPQIHHTANLSTPAGFMTCSEFVDGNGKRYKEGVPAIKLE